MGPGAPGLPASRWKCIFSVGLPEPVRDLPGGCLACGLALFALSIGIGLAGLAGMTIHRGLILLVTGVLFLASLWVGFRSRRLRSAANASPELPSTPGQRIDLWQIAFLMLGGAAVLLAVGKGYHTADEIQIWGVKGYGVG